ncbi:MAG: nucleotide exchange factor GrpE [Dehalococcoidia bacterium]
MREEEREVTPEEEQTGEEQAGEEPAPTDKQLAEQYLANWQRAQADFVNYKKRVEQDKAEFARFANSNLMSSLLPVIDDFERALENVPEEVADSGWVEGIEMIYRKMMSILESLGLSTIKAEGEEFDPNYHEALMHEEGEEGKVLEELQKGYMVHDRLLRPAKVKVGKGEG